MPKRDAMSWRLQGLSFAYEGGAYIDVYASGQNDPFEVINVWDYEKGESTIKGLTRASRVVAFHAVVRQWLAETWASEGENYRENVEGFPEFYRALGD